MRPSLEKYYEWILTEDGVGTAKDYENINSEWHQTIVDVRAEEILEYMADALRVAAGSAGLGRIPVSVSCAPGAQQRLGQPGDRRAILLRDRGGRCSRVIDRPYDLHCRRLTEFDVINDIVSVFE